MTTSIRRIGRLAVHGLLVPLALSLVVTGAPLAQGGDGAAGEAASGPAAPSPITASRIPSEAEKTSNELRMISTRAVRDPRIELIIEEFPAKARALRERASRDSARLAGAEHHRGLLYTVGGDWQARGEDLAAWRAVVEDRTETLAKDVGRLSELRERWKVTRDAAVETSLSTALIERIDSTLLQIARTRKAVDESLSPLLNVQDDLAELQRTAAAVLDHARSAHDSLRNHILDIDRPELWNLEFRQEESAWIAAGDILRDEGARSIDYLESRSDRIIGYGLLAAGVLLLCRWLSRREESRAAEDQVEGSGVSILRRPWSATALVMLFGTIFYFDDAPLIMLGLSVIALVVPLSRLLPTTNVASTQWAVYVLGAWMAIELTRQNLVPEPIVSRMILLFEALSVTVLFTWLLRPSRLFLVVHVSRTLRALGSALRFVAPLAVVSVLSNAVGNVALAELIIEGTLTSLYAAFVLYVIDQLLKAVWRAFLDTPQARRSRIVQNHASLLQHRGEIWIRVALQLLWIHISLNGFRLRGLVYDGIWSGLNARTSIGELEIALIDFLLGGLMIWLSFVASRFVRFVLDDEILPRARLARGVPFAISTVVRYVVLVLGFMLAVAASGLDTSRFALLIGAFGVGIGIGLQDVVNNFVSGLILLFERPIQLGDTVEVNGMLGEVKQIGLRASTLRTFDGAEVVLPNSAFVSNQFVNWTLSDRSRRIELPVGVAYGTDPERVIEVLMSVLEAHPSILSDPEPAVVFDAFGDSSLNFLLRAWTNEFDRWKAIRGDLGVQAIHALDAAGIEIPFPQRDLHLRSISPDLRPEES